MHRRMRGGWKATIIIGGSLIFASVTTGLAQARPLTQKEQALLADSKICWTTTGFVYSGQRLRELLEVNIKGGGATGYTTKFDVPGEGFYIIPPGYGTKLPIASGAILNLTSAQGWRKIPCPAGGEVASITQPLNFSIFFPPAEPTSTELPPPELPPQRKIRVGVIGGGAYLNHIDVNSSSGFYNGDTQGGAVATLLGG
jgi:hypothetical protein